jgi:hypothetical protein
MYRFTAVPERLNSFGGISRPVSVSFCGRPQLKASVASLPRAIEIRSAVTSASDSPANCCDHYTSCRSRVSHSFASKLREHGFGVIIRERVYRAPDHWLVALDVFNLFDAKWNDIEYYYVSRLQNEPTPRPDFVVHPGVPRTVRVRFQLYL